MDQIIRTAVLALATLWGVNIVGCAAGDNGDVSSGATGPGAASASGGSNVTEGGSSASGGANHTGGTAQAGCGGLGYGAAGFGSGAGGAGPGGGQGGTGGSSMGGAGGSSATGGFTVGGGPSSGGNGGNGGTGAVAPMYLISVDHAHSPSRLLKIDMSSGQGTTVCHLPPAYDSYNYHSSTFSRDGFLFATNYDEARLDQIDPCTCQVTPIGPTGYQSIPGITADQSNGLFGIEVSSDSLISLNTYYGTGTLVGLLGYDFINSGATWSDALNGGNGGLYAIDFPSNYLYSIDPTTGTATPIVLLDDTFVYVGIELHPFDGQLYACTNDGVLRHIDPQTGHVSLIGNGMGHTGGCNNLAAPWVVVPCLQ